MKKKKATKLLKGKEIATLTKVLNEFDLATLRDTGVHRISGGFADSKLFDYDNEYIDIELKHGVQSDCENRVHTEQWKLKRSVLSQKKSVKQMVREIEDC